MLRRTGTARGASLIGGALAASVGVFMLPSQTPASSAAEVSRSSSPVAGGTLVMARASDVFNFDPANAPDQESISTVLDIYDRVTQFGPNGQILPDLASGWTFSKDHKTITFNLRKGVRFSDGSPLTAADVAFSITRALNPKSIYAVLWGGAVKRATAIGQLQVRVDLRRPFAPLLSTLATAQGSVVSMNAWRRLGKAAAQHPVGTGPFTLQSWEKGNQLTLVPNTYYWGKKPYLSKVVFKVVGDDNARILQLRSGTVDAIDTVPPNQVQSLRSAGNSVEIVYGQSTLLIPMNEGVKPFQDRNVRLALSSALNREAIAKVSYFSLAKPALSPLPSGSLFYQPKYGVPFDLAKAKAYLAKSSVPKGFSFTLTVPAGNAAFSSLAQIWAASLKQIGVTANIVQLEATTAFDRWLQKKYEVLLQPWANDTPDAMEFAELGIAGQDGFFTGYRNPLANKITAAAEATLAPAARQSAYAEIQRIAAQDVPQIYAVSLPLIWASSAKVHGFAPNAQGAYGFNRVWKGR
jgi:peptide/nickel transport system substrate-binding protein